MPRCKHCKEKFEQIRFLQKTCSDYCEKEYRKTNPKKPINKKSDKRKLQESIYKKIRVDFLKENSKCEACGKKATEVHHKNKRNNERLNDVNFFMAICSNCHRWIHDNSNEARIKGWLK